MSATPEAAARILVLASTYPRWPDDTLPPFVHELARRLTGRYEMHVLAPHAVGCRTYEVMDGVQVHRFRYLPARFETLAYAGGMLPGLRRRPWRLLALPLFIGAEWLTVVRLLRRYRFNVVHAHWVLPHGLIALLARVLCGYRPALVCTAHGADIYGLQGGLARTLQRYTLSRSEHVTVVSNALRESVLEITGDRVNCSVLPMGVDTQARFTLPDSVGDRKGLLFVGRLADKKGVHVLLDALARLRDLPGMKLSIVGTGTEELRLRAQVARHRLEDLVEFAGPVPNRDLPARYRSASILVFPSVITAYGDQEGLGLVPVEALACGCAVVASDLPAIRDVIRDGETGLLTHSGDPESLAAAIAQLWRDPALRARLASRGRTFVQERFDWERVAAGYAALLGAYT